MSRIQRVGVLDDLLSAIDDAEERILLASPFIGRQVGTLVAARARGRRRQVRGLDCRGITALEGLEASAVASGYLSPSAVRALIGVPMRFRSVPNLHAKVFVIDDWAYVGSGNLTERGLHKGNIELGVILRGPAARGVVEEFEHWWRAATNARRIDPAMLRDLARAESNRDCDPLMAMRSRTSADLLQEGIEPLPRIPGTGDDGRTTSRNGSRERRTVGDAFTFYWNAATVRDEQARRRQRLRGTSSNAPASELVRPGDRVYVIHWRGGQLHVVGAFTARGFRGDRGWRSPRADEYPARYRVEAEPGTSTQLRFDATVAHRDLPEIIYPTLGRSPVHNHNAYRGVHRVEARTARMFERVLAA